MTTARWEGELTISAFVRAPAPTASESSTPFTQTTSWSGHEPAEPA